MSMSKSDLDDFEQCDRCDEPISTQESYVLNGLCPECSEFSKTNIFRGLG